MDGKAEKRKLPGRVESVERANASFEKEGVRTRRKSANQRDEIEVRKGKQKPILLKRAQQTSSFMEISFTNQKRFQRAILRHSNRHQ